LRSIPGFAVVRPCDANEVAICWLKIIEDKEPAGIVLSRQNVLTLDRQIYASAQNARKGGYVLQDAPNSNPEVILIATGSEIELALNAQKELNLQSISTRVVSMPCVEWFQDQSPSYQESVLPRNVKAKIAIEAGSTFGWYQFVGLEGCVIGLDHYGASGKPDLLYKEFGITVERIVAKAKELKK
jgi:transketolase